MPTKKSPRPASRRMSVTLAVVDILGIGIVVASVPLRVGGTLVSMSGDLIAGVGYRIMSAVSYIDAIERAPHNRRKP